MRYYVWRLVERGFITAEKEFYQLIRERQMDLLAYEILRERQECLRSLKNFGL